MSDFVNTIDLLGDELALSKMVEKTINEFNDDVITVVGDYSFRSCTSLTSVNLPNVTSIGIEAFRYCSALTSVYLPATPPTIRSTTSFGYINNACVFYIPTGSLSAYQSATNWSTLTGQYSFVEEDR